MANLDSEFAITEQQLRLADRAAQDRLQRQQADDRSHIAKLIVWAFVLLMGLVVVAIIAGLVYFSGDWQKVSEPAKLLMTILSSVMLPVVTLVIGYYFASK